MGEEYRHLLKNKVRADVEEIRFGKMIALGQEGTWTHLDGI